MSQINKSLISISPLLITPFNLKLNLFFRFFGALAILIIFSLLIVSIYQLNKYTAEVYFINNSEKEIIKLSQENKALEINLARAKSLSNIDQYVQSFERAGKIKYIRVLENTALAK